MPVDLDEDEVEDEGAGEDDDEGPRRGGDEGKGASEGESEDPRKGEDVEARVESRDIGWAKVTSIMPRAFSRLSPKSSNCEILSLLNSSSGIG